MCEWLLTKRGLFRKHSSFILQKVSNFSNPVPNVSVDFANSRRSRTPWLASYRIFGMVVIFRKKIPRWAFFLKIGNICFRYCTRFFVRFWRCWAQSCFIFLFLIIFESHLQYSKWKTLLTKYTSFLLQKVSNFKTGFRDSREILIHFHVSYHAYSGRSKFLVKKHQCVVSKII